MNSNQYDLNDLGPSWELMKQDMPEHRLKTAQDRIAEGNLDELRAKLTSWPALFSKRYEVARALALGWWYKHAAKDRATITENVIFGAFCLSVVVFAFWLASR